MPPPNPRPELRDSRRPYSARPHDPRWQPTFATIFTLESEVGRFRSADLNAEEGIELFDCLDFC